MAKRVMEEDVRWVSKSEAAAALDISLSTLDRMIRRGEVAVRREGRRVYVQVKASENVDHDDLLLRAVAREEELQRMVREMEESLSEWKFKASELERELDEARTSAATVNLPSHESETERGEEVAEQKDTKELLTAALVTALVLLVGLGLLWWFVLR